MMASSSSSSSSKDQANNNNRNGKLVSSCCLLFMLGCMAASWIVRNGGGMDVVFVVARQSQYDDDNDKPTERSTKRQFAELLNVTAREWRHAKFALRRLTTRQIKHKLGCKRYFHPRVLKRHPRPIHSQATWQFMRAAHRQITKQRAAIPLDQNGFAKRIQVRQVEGKGRGLFAAEPIRRGELVWQALQTAEFKTAAQYRHFLALLPEPLACDVLQWAYVSETDDEDESGDVQGKSIFIDLDEGCFMNHSGRKPLLGCHPDIKDVEKDCDNDKLYAQRDIQPGEELMENYSGFAMSSGWREFGL